MEWLSGLFTGPYSEARIAALAVPVIFAIYFAINASKKEQERKGWHPATKVVVGVFAALFVLTFIIPSLI